MNKVELEGKCTQVGARQWWDQRTDENLEKASDQRKKFSDLIQELWIACGVVVVGSAGFAYTRLTASTRTACTQIKAPPAHCPSSPT